MANDSKLRDDRPRILIYDSAASEANTGLKKKLEAGGYVQFDYVNHRMFYSAVNDPRVYCVIVKVSASKGENIVNGINRFHQHVTPLVYSDQVSSSELGQVDYWSEAGGIIDPYSANVQKRVFCLLREDIWATQTLESQVAEETEPRKPVVVVFDKTNLGGLVKTLNREGFEAIKHTDYGRMVRAKIAPSVDLILLGVDKKCDERVAKVGIPIYLAPLGEDLHTAQEVVKGRDIFKCWVSKSFPPKRFTKLLRGYVESFSRDAQPKRRSGGNYRAANTEFARRKRTKD